MSCTHFLSLSFSSVYSSFIQTLSFLSEENYGKREREAKDWVDPESFKNQTKHNSPHPPSQQNRTFNYLSAGQRDLSEVNGDIILIAQKCARP